MWLSLPENMLCVIAEVIKIEEKKRIGEDWEMPNRLLIYWTFATIFPEMRD